MTQDTITMRQATRINVVSELGRYRLIAQLARGGMGNVFLAVAQGPGGFNKLFAVKELKPELADDETHVQMFVDEARLAARLQHPNVVQTHEVGCQDGRHYMVMEFLDGRSLHRIGRVVKLPVGAHVRIITEALLGLHHAHELTDFEGSPLRIVHRDVSPLNLFVTFDGQAKLLDFGVAKARDSTLQTKSGILKGRVAYMAPEQAWGEKVDRRADLFSIGVMLWEAAARRRLWRGLTEVQILSRLTGEGVPRLRDVCPDAPEDLDAICARATERVPDDRYATAQELFEDLEEHLETRDDALSMREIGSIAAVALSAERKKMSAVIEETVTRMLNGPPSGVMPTLEAQLGGGTRSSLSPPREISRTLRGIQAPEPTAYARSYAAAMLSARSPASTRATPSGFMVKRRMRVRWKPLLAAASIACVLGALAALLTGHTPRSAHARAAAPEHIARFATRADIDLVAPTPTLAFAPAPAPAPALAPALAPAPARAHRSPAARAVSPPPPAPPAPSPVPTPVAPTLAIGPAGGQAPIHRIVTTNPYGRP
jgi:serine/threonine-protein kinase